MSLWSTIKSAVSSLFKKEDDNKKSSSSSTSKISKASKPTTSNKSAIEQANAQRYAADKGQYQKLEYAGGYSVKQ